MSESKFETIPVTAAIPGDARSVERPLGGLVVSSALLEAFLNPNVSLSLTEQMQVMDAFWHEYEIPKLSSAQEATLAHVLQSHPDKRVVPTILPARPVDRPGILEGAKQFPKNTLNTQANALWMPPETWEYSALLREPETAMESGLGKLMLGYNGANGEVTTRHGYRESLRRAGQLVLGNSEVTWTFPVIGVGVDSPRTNATAGSLTASTHPLESPETLEVIQLLHQANGTPPTNMAVDFPNEAIYHVREHDKGGNRYLEFLEAVRIATLRWDPNSRQIRSNFGDPQHQEAYFGRREAVNGIS